MNKNLFMLASLTLFFTKLPAQLNPALDVQHYSFAIQLNDSNNIINAEAQITIKLLQDVNEVKLGLVQKRQDGKGMIVTKVKQDGNDAGFLQQAQNLVINAPARKGEEHLYTIAYEGMPADGLIISQNKHGDRTFFSDNWPNRAHNWLP